MQYLIPSWPAPGNVKAFSTTRLQGYSNSPYSSFNLATHVGDDEEVVQRNRALLEVSLNLPRSPCWLQQIHSNQVLQIGSGDISAMNPTADASVTRSPHCICVVMTADCLPIIVCDRAGTVVAAIHAGWRGLASGVIENTLQHFPKTDLLAWLGPAIGPQVFEVSNDVFDTFTSQDKETHRAFKPIGVENKWLADIYYLASLRLKKCGVENIFGGEYCTYTQHKLFYSYRRDQGITGRMATLIWLST